MTKTKAHAHHGSSKPTETTNTTRTIQRQHTYHWQIRAMTNKSTCLSRRVDAGVQWSYHGWTSSPCNYAGHNDDSLMKPWCSCCCRSVATEPETRHYCCKARSRRRKVLLTVQRPDSWDQTSQFQLVVSHTLQHNPTLITRSLNHNSDTPQIKTPQSADLTTKKYWFVSTTQIQSPSFQEGRFVRTTWSMFPHS